MIWNDLTVTTNYTIRVGTGGAIERNADPSAWDNVWVSVASGTTADLYGVGWNGTRVVAVGVGGVVRVSDDEGATWYAATSGVASDLYAIANGDNVFITVGALGVILTSQEGLSWEPVDSGTFWNLWDVTVLNAEYTAVGDNDVIVSGILTSTLLDVVVAETVLLPNDLLNNGVFGQTADDGFAFDESVHRQTYTTTPILVAVTEHIYFEDQGATDVGGVVQTGFSETTTNLDVVVTESIMLDDADGWMYQGDVAQQFFMFLNDEMSVSSVQSTDQLIGNALAADAVAINDRPFINNETLSDTFALADTLSGGYGVTILDSIGINDALSALARFDQSVVDTVAINDTPSVVGTMLVTVADTVGLSDTASANQIINEMIRDGLTFSVALTLDGETYLAWVMNTETMGVTNYENFRFNSMCEFGGEYYATDGDKIYRLGGNTDAGAGINAEFSPGATDFGSAFLKRMDRAYLGLRADGQMVLKVVTDEKAEDWYLLEHVPDAIGETRVKIGKGLQARYWRIKLANKGGADFDVDSLRLLPLKMQRRI